MPGDQQCTLTAHLAPRSNTAALLRVIAILHSRGTEVHQLTFESRGGNVVTVRATVTLGNVGGLTLRQSLLRPPEVMDVVARCEADRLPRPALACREQEG
jgi:hypothetical protein